MKLLLTSNGLSNDSIAKAFQELIGKEPKESKVAFIPTAANLERDNKDWLIDDLHRIKKRGYFVDIIELTALSPEEIKAALEKADAIFVGGGSTFYLSYWMQKKKLFVFLHELLKTRIYAGISAGSMIAGKSLLPSDALEDLAKFKDDDYYDGAIPDQASNKALNFVDIVFRPHLNSEHFPKVRKEVLEQFAPLLSAPLYALDDESALRVSNGNIDVITEGEWIRLDPKTGDT
jgi:dipeptidase E